MKKNIALIGMSGAGKSTIGVLLAKALGKEFIDTDIMIQKVADNVLQNIINDHGIEYFINLEAQVLKEVNVRNSIISTGGSVIYNEEAMAHLNTISEVIYLKVDYREIESRLNNIKTRGIVMGNHKTLKSLYDERIYYYEKYANTIIDCNGLDIERIVELLVDRHTLK